MDKFFIAGDGSLARVIHDMYQDRVLGFIGLEERILLGKPVFRLDIPTKEKVVLAVLYPKHRKEFVDKIGEDNFISLCSGKGLYKENKGIVTLPDSWVMNNAEIKEYAHVHTGAIVGHDCIVGEYSFIGPGVILGGGAKIDSHCRIGMGARILPKVKMHYGSSAAAGSVVVKDVPPGVTVAGVPAKPIEHKNKERF